MAKNLVFRNTDGLNEFWDLGELTAPGTPVLSISGQAGVTLTGTGNYTISDTIGPITISGIPQGGVGLDATEASIATDGTWELDVLGGLTTTVANTLVYFDDTDGLTLTENATPANSPVFGKVNYPKGYLRVAGVLPIKIGVFA